jgi:hypothetical protein
VIAADDERDPKLEKLGNTLRVWAGGPPEPLGQPVEVSNPAQLSAAARSFTPLPGVTVQVSLEETSFHPDPTVDQEFLKSQTGARRCLVVRAADRQGRLLQARLPDLENLEIKEHQYFFVRDGNPPTPASSPFVAGYTGVFGPIDTPFGVTDRLTIELFSVSDAIKDRDRAITIPLGVPQIDGPRPDIRDEGGRGTVDDAGLR